MITNKNCAYTYQNVQIKITARLNDDLLKNM